MESMESRTKIVATLGPASQAPEVLDELIRAGVDVVRLNLSHGKVDEHVARLHAVRASADRVGHVVAVLADLPGPKVRAGQLPAEGVVLVTGARLDLVAGEGPSTVDRFQVDYVSLIDDLEPGDKVVIGDGAISLRVVSMEEHVAVTEVLTGGTTQGRPGVHIPSERLRLRTPTADDLRLAAIMAAEGVDFLAVSFVRAAADLQAVRDAVRASLPTGSRIPHLVAKIETLPAVAALEEIAAASDAVMVARGDLGIECPLEDVPHLQKRIVRHCVEMGVPVITATQMLESMITAPAPTRAEVSDIANAVFDGTDALMLSAETAIGHDPVGVVMAMRRIAVRAEMEASYASWGTRLGRLQRRQWPAGPERITMAITHAAGLAAVDAGADAILCCTQSGRTARAMARFRPTPGLVGLAPDIETVRNMALSWGVTPVQVERYHSTDEVVWHAVETAVQRGLVHTGQTVLVLAGAPDRPSGAATDVLRIVQVQ
jgi:pyruvate kinase